ncbi:hypothetical protein ACWDFH_21215 [Streptomyces kronopolitis]
MNPNNDEAGMLESSRLRESNAAVAASIVPQAPDETHEGNGLFPVDSQPPIARPLVLVTRGRVEFLGRCPNCQNMHRHTHLGKVTGPCGAEYELQPKAKLKGAA